jgi:hypothetical protein
MAEFMFMDKLAICKPWALQFFRLEGGPRPIGKCDLGIVPGIPFGMRVAFWPPTASRGKGGGGGGGGGGPSKKGAGKAAPLPAEAVESASGLGGAASSSSASSSSHGGHGAGPLIPVLTAAASEDAGDMAGALGLDMESLVVVEEVIEEPEPLEGPPEDDDKELLLARMLDLHRDEKDEKLDEAVLKFKTSATGSSSKPGAKPTPGVGPAAALSPGADDVAGDVLDTTTLLPSATSASSSSGSSSTTPSSLVVARPARVNMPALLCLDVVGGNITYYASGDRFVATCRNPDHGRCVKQIGVFSANSCNGRPLGALLAWLACGGALTDKAAHWDAVNQIASHDVRILYRLDFIELAKTNPVANQLLMKELDPSSPDELEPLDY